jgi:positive regulator of sigma E activity
MRAFELIAAVLVGLVLLVALKLIGVVIKIALIGALIGMVLGFVIARAFRSRA